MMSIFEDMLRSLENPAMQHAAIVHLPIGLAFIGVVFALLTALVTKSKALRWSAVCLYTALAFFAWLAMQSGEDAHALMTRNQPGDVHSIIDHHEELAEKIWIYAAAVAALLALSAIDHVVARRGAAWLAVAGALFTTGWVAVTGHHGGTAVYDYAVGTANPVMFEDTMPARRAPETGEEDERETASEVAGELSELMASGMSEPEAFFVARVQPILEASCQRCHNPRRAHRSGDLDQTSMDAMLHGGRSGPALVPGEPEQSLIMMRITSEDDEVRMPPMEPLEPEEIEALRQWIADGAVWVETE